MSDNKVIYMTYKKKIPEFVPERWKILNPNYSIDFSLDEDCIRFMREHFNDSVADLFVRIPAGMYKADLWRLCKLYLCGGVYADVDLVPYLQMDTLDNEVSFYSCLSLAKRSIFQALIVNPKPKSPIILQCLVSFLMNHPYVYANGPTFDMYNCLAYTFKEQHLLPDTKYHTDKVRMYIPIGPSSTNCKEIDLTWFPEDVDYTFELHPIHYKDRFEFMIQKNKLTVRRLDEPTGWGHPHVVDICIKSKETLFLFKEFMVPGRGIEHCYVASKGKKILDSRDRDYYHQRGW